MDSLFTGAPTRRPTVNLGGLSAANSHHDLVLQARQQRIQRERDRAKLDAALRIQAFYRGRAAAHGTRQRWRQQYDALVPAATSPASASAPPPDPATALDASRRLALAFSAGNRLDQRRLAHWCRFILRPGQGQPDKQPLLFALFRPEYDPDHSWPTLARMLAALLFAEATAFPSLPQSPLFLEVTKMLCDPANYVRYKVAPAIAPPHAVLAFLFEQRDLYPRIAQLIKSIPDEQRTHPTLAPAIALALLPFRAFPAPSAPSSTSTSTSLPASTPERSAALLALAVSLLSLPNLLTTRLAPAQRALFLSPPVSAPAPAANIAPFPLWDLVATLASAPAAAQLGALSPAERAHLLAALAELALSGDAPRLAADKGAGLVARDVSNWCRVVSGLMRGLPKGAFEPVEEETSVGRAPREDGAREMDGDEDDEDDEDEHEDPRAVARARRALGQAAAGDGDDDDGDTPMATTTTAAVLDPSTRTSLQRLASREHLVALLAWSNRFSSSTRPALATLLVTLLSHLPSSPSPRGGVAAPGLRDEALHVLLYAPSASGLVRELYRAHLRAGPLARALTAARERTSAVLAALGDSADSGEWSVLLLVVELYSRCLVTLGDDEFYASASAAAGGGAAARGQGRNPLSLDEVVGLSALARNVAFAMYWSEDGSGGGGARERGEVGGTGCGWEWVRGVMTRFLQQVHARDSRRQFTPEGHWLMTSQFDLKSFVQTAVYVLPLFLADATTDAISAQTSYEDERLEAEGDLDASAATSGPDGDADMRDTRPSRTRSTAAAASKRQLALISPRLGVLNHIPFVVPFDTRVAIFRQFVASDFARLGLGEGAAAGFGGPRSRHRAVVRRTRLAEDAYAHLNGLGAELKKRIEITFIDEHGMEESGIDGGGLFKELLTSLSKEVFDTDRGLWLATSEQELYPNPHAYAKQPDQLAWFTFIGRVLGKAMYQGILVNVKFAAFFLSKWLGRQSYLDDLASLDPELYQGLLKLKNYPGNVEEDLSLNFTISDEDFGVSRTIDLIPRGSEIPVTNENRMQYIVLVSNYRLNVQIAPQCRAFFAGLSEIINERWLRLFSQSELAVLVGGTEEAIDIDDLRRNTVYSGWDAEENTPTIQHFWDVVRSFDKTERAKLVRFVTACERPPLLGFAQLNPLFAIRKAGDDESRLPTSATCVNLLKLPEYSDRESLRQKLLYAINSGAGFDLS
ncbi:ubiquitin-ubiquitin ligase HUL5 [Rhodotorula paludigena]|uniref:ubiquitin-ubiquitin ligase HUL5 n=1 Tax=Rhodotorula paludigena TaxID=86838 RepID=UPI00317CD943